MMGHRCFRATVALALTLAAGPAAATVLYAYDDLGRVTSITYDDGKRVTYTYDPAGNRTQHVVDDVQNQWPTAVDDSMGVVLMTSNIGVVYPLANDSDPNSGDLLVVQSVTTPSLGTAMIGGGGSYVTYTYTGSYPSTSIVDSFNYTVSDGHGGTASATVNVDISPGGPCVPPPGELECVDQ
jgi:YD repeat-containing protein